MLSRSRVRTASSNSAANNSNSNTSNSNNLNTVSDIEIGGASPDAEAAVPLVSFGSSRRDNDDSSGNLDPSASLAARSKAYLMHRRFYWGGSAPSLYLALKSPSLLLSLLALLLMLVVAVSIDLSSSAARASVSQAGESTESNTTTSEHLPLFDFDALASGQFGPQWASREWLAGAPDGSYLVTDSDGNLVVHHVDSRNTTVFVDSGDLYLDHVPLQYSKYIVSPTLQHVLFVANIEPVWRHSFYATYYLFDVNQRTLRPVVATTSMPPAPAVTPTSVPLPIDDTTSVDNRLALAVWSPTGETIAIVSRAHNIHVVSTASATTDSQVQLTFDGSVGDAVRNGVADWVYEEEVFSGSSCLWFSPLGTRLAYLKFVDTGVAAFKVQKYFSGGGDSSKPSSNAGVEQQYPSEIVIRYPKAGTANPVATLHIAMPSATSAAARDVEVAFSPADSMFPDDDRLFVEVNWVSEDALLVRMMNRVQDQQLLYLVQSPKETSSDGNGTSANSATGEIWTGTLVRNEKSSDGAWLMSNLQPIHVLRPTATAMASTKTFKPSPSESANPLSAYIELAEDETGNAHIAYYPYPTAKTPAKWLTRGADHEVTQIVHVDADRGVVFYLATAGVDGKAVPRAAVPPLQSTKNLGSIQRHLYSVKIEGGNFVKLSPPDGVTWKAAVPMWNFSNDDKSPVDADTPVGSVGWFDASFSAGGGFCLLSYMGPDVPFQKIISLYDTSLNWPFKKNDPIYDKLKNTAMPKIQYTTIPLKSVPGVELNSVITVPSTFDPKNTTMKYPLLISVYGGPNSQTVKMTYGYGFESALSNTGYIILHVDARGTCCKGRAFRSVVSKHLGLAEAADVVEATEYMIRLGFVDPKRIAVWGWSFGGFLASKVIELNSGVVTTGIAVAPVTDWRFYDSIYTERYMKTPLMNPKGYETSAIADMAGFKNSEFLLIHGTGDDNVHYQNSLALIWKLTASRVHSYQVQFYPDSDHSMNAGNAFIELFDLLHRFLNERFQMSRTAKRSERFAAHGVIDSGGGDGLEWDLFVNNL